MLVTAAELKPFPYFRDPAKPYIEKMARAQSKWLMPYDDPKLFPQDGDRMLATGMRGAQFRIYREPARNRIAATGRRFGKTKLCVHELTRAAQTGWRREIGYIAPTLKDAKRLMWLDLKRSLPQDMIADIQNTVLSITIRGFESRIRLFGADRPESVYGEGFDFLVMDEAQSIPAGFFQQAVRPTLVDKSGELLMTLRPEGFNWAFDEFVSAEQDITGLATAFNFTTLDGENVPPSEIERERLQLDPAQFSQEYEGSFTNPQGRVYTQFTRKDNVDPKAIDQGGMIHVGMDFNVAPFTCVICSMSPEGDLYVWDEMEEFGSHTALVADKLKKRFTDREIVVYPDASGRSRSASGQGLTNFHLLAQTGFRVDAPTKNPPVRDRINVLQAVFRNAAGQVRIKIHPRCRQLIRSLEALSYNAAGVPDKESGFDHLPDALGYLTWRRFPIVRYRTGMAKLAA